MAKLMLSQYSSHDLTLGGINLNFSQIENKVCSGKDVAFLKTEELSLFVVFVASVPGTKKEPAPPAPMFKLSSLWGCQIFCQGSPFRVFMQR